MSGPPCSPKQRYMRTELLDHMRFNKYASFAQGLALEVTTVSIYSVEHHTSIRGQVRSSDLKITPLKHKFQQGFGEHQGFNLLGLHLRGCLSSGAFAIRCNRAGTQGAIMDVHQRNFQSFRSCCTLERCSADSALHASFLRMAASPAVFARFVISQPSTPARVATGCCGVGWLEFPGLLPVSPVR